MVLFTRNPRLRSLAQVYGFFIVIGSGTFHILRTSTLYLDRNAIFAFVKTHFEAYKAGKSPIQEYMSVYNRYAEHVARKKTSHEGLKRTYEMISVRKQGKQETIREELLVRRGLEERITNQQSRSIKTRY